MKTIDQLLDELIAREGGYVNDPRDSGGETMYGITERVARAYGYAGPMRHLPLGSAKAIYRRIYWDRPGFARVADTFPRVAEELFDTGVNMGPAVAARFLQRSLNVLNLGGRSYPDLVVDGDIGPATMRALSGFRQARGRAGEGVLMLALNALQGARYIELAEASPKNEAFLYGWLAHRVIFA